jgi:hypothetical protein
MTVCFQLVTLVPSVLKTVTYIQVLIKDIETTLNLPLRAQGVALPLECLSKNH